MKSYSGEWTKRTAVVDLTYPGALYKCGQMGLPKSCAVSIHGFITWIHGRHSGYQIYINQWIEMDEKYRDHVLLAQYFHTVRWY